MCECSILITYCSCCIYMLCKCFLLMLNVITWSHDNLQYDCLSEYFLQIYSHNDHTQIFTVYVDPFGFTLIMQCSYSEIYIPKYDSKFSMQILIHSFWLYVDQFKISWVVPPGMSQDHYRLLSSLFCCVWYFSALETSSPSSIQIIWFGIFLNHPLNKDK